MIRLKGRLREDLRGGRLPGLDFLRPLLGSFSLLLDVLRPLLSRFVLRMQRFYYWRGEALREKDGKEERGVQPPILRVNG